MMRPLEPHELFERCDVAGEAQVLALLPSPSSRCSPAKLDFERVVRGRLESICGQLPTIAFVEFNRVWREPGVEGEPRLERSGKEPSTVAVVKLPRSPHPESDLTLGTATAHCEVETRIAAHLNWDPQAGCYRTTWRPRSRQPRSEPIVLGTPDVRYEAGTRVATHLNWDPEAGCYRTTWWNAVSVLGKA